MLTIMSSSRSHFVRQKRKRILLLTVAAAAAASRWQHTAEAWTNRFPRQPQHPHHHSLGWTFHRCPALPIQQSHHGHHHHHPRRFHSSPLFSTAQATSPPIAEVDTRASSAVLFNGTDVTLNEDNVRWEEQDLFGDDDADDGSRDEITQQAEASNDEEGYEDAEYDDEVDIDIEDDNAESDDADENENEENEEEADDKSTDPLMDEYRVWNEALQKAIKTIERKKTSLEAERDKANQVELTVARAQLLVGHLYLFTDGVTTATVRDWNRDGAEVELTLDPSYHGSASDEADALFAQARRLKRGSAVVQTLLDDVDVAMSELGDLRLDMDSVVESATTVAEEQSSDVSESSSDSLSDSLSLSSSSSAAIDVDRFRLVQDRLRRSARKTGFKEPTEDDVSNKKGNGKRQANSNTNVNKKRRMRKPALGTPASNVRKLVSPDGTTVLVGRNRRGNEYLSLNVAKSRDLWLHARGCPGAHVIVKGGRRASAGCVQFAANVAVFYSDLRNEVGGAEVSSALPKHLRKPRGAPLGAISVREEHGTYVGLPGDVPSTLVEARERSGQSDEYRTVDKAKHRQRTKQAQAKERAKRKQKLKEKERR